MRRTPHIPPHSDGEVSASEADGGVMDLCCERGFDPSVASSFSGYARKARNRATSPYEWGGE